MSYFKMRRRGFPGRFDCTCASMWLYTHTRLTYQLRKLNTSTVRLLGNQFSAPFSRTFTSDTGPVIEVRLEG